MIRGKLCIMVVVTELYPFRPLSETLTTFKLTATSKRSENSKLCISVHSYSIQFKRCSLSASRLVNAHNAFEGLWLCSRMTHNSDSGRTVTFVSDVSWTPLQGGLSIFALNVYNLELFLPPLKTLTIIQGQ